jgi:hypothetical protein
VIGIAAFSLVIGVTGCYSAHLQPWNTNFRFLRQPRSQIHSWLLEQAPPGSSMSDVRALIEKNRWRADFVNVNQGFLDQRDYSGTGGQVIGVKSYRASLGDYPGIPFDTNVTVFWAFNADGKLIDVWVWKTVNGL